MVDNASFPAVQFIGKHDDILTEISSIYYNEQWITNPKYELSKIFNIKVNESLKLMSNNPKFNINKPTTKVSAKPYKFIIPPILLFYLYI